MTLSRTSLAEAIDIPAWLEEDRNTSWQARIQRDQQIDKQVNRSSYGSSRRVRNWWREVQPTSDNSSGHALAAIFSRVRWLAITIGFIAGIVLTSALLHYDGSQPINILVLLVVLVVAPLLLFIISLFLPFWSSTSVLSGLNPGGMLVAFIKKKSEALNDFFSSSRTDNARDKLLRWKLLLYSQQFGIALAVAALITLITRVSFSDLAFGWSTTLDIQASSLSPWIQAFAWPWSTWFPEALPANNLIEQSRFFRLENDTSTLSALTLTGWWKYIAMCLLVYGIGFRLLALWFASFNYNKAVENLLMQHSEVTALLDRFNLPVNDYQPAPVVSAKSSASNSSSFNVQAADIIICWNNAKLSDELANKIQASNIVKVNGGDTLEFESDVFKNIETNTLKKIHIVTKSWEPPLLEFHDLIQVLRDQFGSEVTISIQPVAENSNSADLVDAEIWRHSIEKIQDSKVYVV